MISDKQKKFLTESLRQAKYLKDFKTTVDPYSKTWGENNQEAVDNYISLTENALKEDNPIMASKLLGHYFGKTLIGAVQEVAKESGIEIIN